MVYQNAEKRVIERGLYRKLNMFVERVPIVAFIKEFNYVAKRTDNVSMKDTEHVRNRLS